MSTQPESAQERDILLAALELPEGQRDSFLNGACMGRSELKERILKLLEAAALEGSFMERPLLDIEPTLPPDAPEDVGKTIGPFKLLQAIGEGGMGTVYMAEQSHPVERRVALKIIKAGMDSRQVIARFEAERQALAMMDHPNIAKVLDAGTTESGRPYFVMELVKGIPITKYCDDKKLSIRERLELMVPVCNAIQHAHQKGIIHRDIKPGNVLVTQYDGKPVPKVIDFGIAKATAQKLTDKSMFTEFGQIIGTLEYMSPEQAEMNQLDIDTRSDVYSLGVLLYELITGTTPFDKETLLKAGFDKMRSIICETDPPRPSDRISTLSAKDQAVASGHRGTESSALQRSMRAELDWIVMKALEKERTRRYETASHFANDIQSYLDDLPVLACPPSARYKLKKWARRYKGSIFAASLVLSALLLGLVGLAWGLVIAERGRQLAEMRERESIAATLAESRAKSEAIESQRAAELSSQQAIAAEKQARESEQDTKAFSDFLVNDILSAARPEGERGGLGIGVSVLQALDAAANKLEVTFQNRPRAEAIAQRDLGVTYRLIGEIQKAEPHLRRAWELFKQLDGEESDTTLSAQNSLAVSLKSLGKGDEALLLAEDILKRQQAKPGAEDDPKTYKYMRNLAVEYREGGKLQSALLLSDEVVKNHKRLLAADDDELIESKSDLGTTYLFVGKVDEGVELLKEAFESSDRKYGRANLETLNLMAGLAGGYRASKKLDLAIPLLEELVATRKEKQGDDHPSTLYAIFDLASTYQSAGRQNEALELYQEVLKLRRSRLDADHPETLNTICAIGNCLNSLNRHEEAEATLTEALATSKRALGMPHITTENIVFALIDTYSSQKKDPQIQELRAEFDKERNKASTISTKSLQKNVPTDLGWVSIVPETNIVSFAGNRQGDHYLIGNLYGDGVFGDVTLQAPPNRKLGGKENFVAKQDANGQFVWATRFGSHLEDNSVHDVAVDLNGNVFIVGRFFNSAIFGSTSLSSAGDSDGFVAKLNGVSGEFLWVKQIGDSLRDTCSAIEIDSNQNLVISGGLGSVAANSFTHAPDIFVSKLNTDGDTIWSTSVSGEMVAIASELAIDDAGAIFVGGRFQGEAKFPTGAIQSKASPSVQIAKVLSDGFIAKLDSDGKWLWARALTSDVHFLVRKIVCGHQDSVFVSGTFQGTANLDAITMKTGKQYESVVLRVDSQTARIEWARSLGESDTLVNVGGMVVDIQGNVNLLGTFTGHVVFGHQSILAESLNAFWTKVSDSGTFIDTQRVVSGSLLSSSSIHYDSDGNVYMAGTTLRGVLQLPQGRFSPPRAGLFIFKLPLSQNSSRLQPANFP